MKRYRLQLFWLAGWLLCASSSALAQSNSAVIVGSISDATGAAVPAARLTITNQGTNISTTVTATAEGQYTATNIEPGVYRVTAFAQGFSEKSIRDITVFVNQTVRVNVSLEVGTVATRTEVEASAPVVQSETSSIGQVVDSRQVTKMPLDGRSSLNGLLALAPGVMSTGQNPLISGGVWFGSTNLTIDGVSDIDTGNERLGPVVPSLESVEEFKVIANGASAELAAAARRCWSRPNRARINCMEACLSSIATQSSRPRIFLPPAFRSPRSTAMNTGLRWVDRSCGTSSSSLPPSKD